MWYKEKRSRKKKESRVPSSSHNSQKEEQTPHLQNKMKNSDTEKRVRGSLLTTAPVARERGTRKPWSGFGPRPVGWQIFVVAGGRSDRSISHTSVKMHMKGGFFLNDGRVQPQKFSKWSEEKRKTRGILLSGLKWCREQRENSKEWGKPVAVASLQHDWVLLAHQYGGRVR